MKKEALSVVDTLKMALEALEDENSLSKMKTARDILRKALAQQNPQGVSNEQVEPCRHVATFMGEYHGYHGIVGWDNVGCLDNFPNGVPVKGTKFYTHPPVPNAKLTAQQNPQGVSNEQVEPCPDKERNEYVCENRNQCWEPCGELGKSEEHVKVYEQVEPVAWMWLFNDEVWDLSSVKDRYTPISPSHVQVPLYTHPPVPYVVEPRTAQPSDWSVFNTGAEVASGLTFAEAWDYLTPERLDRGWSAVCVVNKDNVPTPQPKEPEQRNASEHLEPVAFETWYEKFHSFAGKSPLLYSDLHCAWQAAKLYTTPPQRKPLTDEEIERLRIEQEFDQWAISEGAFKYAARAIEAAHGITKEDT